MGAAVGAGFLHVAVFAVNAERRRDELHGGLQFVGIEIFQHLDIFEDIRGLLWRGRRRGLRAAGLALRRSWRLRASSGDCECQSCAEQREAQEINPRILCHCSPQNW
jgi:hypothetical protein